MPESVYRKNRDYFVRKPNNASGYDDEQPVFKTVDLSRGNHDESRDSYTRPTWRSSTSRNQEWSADDYGRRYERRSVRYADDDHHDRGQGASTPALHPTLPMHMGSHSPSQMVSVRPRQRTSGPVDYNANVDVPTVWRPEKVASTMNKPNDQTTKDQKARNEAPKVQRDSQHVPGFFQTVFDLNHPQDVSTHLELLITDDHERELEEFSQLQRLGNFGAARDYFKTNLEPYLNNPYVFVQYGQMLLDQGDYLAFEELDPEAVFGKEIRATLSYTEGVEGWFRNLSRHDFRSRSRERPLGARTEAYYRYKDRDVYHEDEAPPIRVYYDDEAAPAPLPRRPPPPPQLDDKNTYEHRYFLPVRDDARRAETGPLALRHQDVEKAKQARPRSRTPSPVERVVIRQRSWSSSRSPTPPVIRDGSRRRVADYAQERRRSRSREPGPERVRPGTRFVGRPHRSPSPPPDLEHIKRIFVEQEPYSRAQFDSQSPVMVNRPFRRARFEPDVRDSNGRHLQRSRSLESVRNHYDSGQDDGSISTYSSNGGPQVQEIEPSSEQDELEILRQNWRLLRAATNIHRNGSFGEGCSEAWYAIENFDFGTEIGSTEIQVVMLTLQLCAQIGRVLPEWYYTDGLQDAAAGWVDWSALFKQLLIQGRIWDFKDLYVAMKAAFSNSADELLFGTRDIKCSLHDDWVLDEDDISTNLAQLGVLLEPYNFWSGCMDEATARAEAIVAHNPTAMKSRPFTRWIIEDAIDALISQEQHGNIPWIANEARLQGFPGIVWKTQSTKSPSVVYVPQNHENPGWFGPVVSAEAAERIQLALNLAKELKDYKSQAECYKLLIQMSQDPTHLFQELAHLQKETQGDKHGHLESLLSSYLICKDRPAQENLLEELQRTSDQGDATTLWARDFIERAVKRTLEGSKSTARLRKPASFYMDLGLSLEVEQFIWQNAEHDPPPSRYRSTPLAQMRHGPVPLPRRPTGAQGQVDIRPLSDLRSYDNSKSPFPRLDSHQQESTYVHHDDPYLIRQSSTEALERARRDREREREMYIELERQARQERAAEIARQREEQDAKRAKERRAQEVKDRHDREVAERLQQVEQPLKDLKEGPKSAEDQAYQDRLKRRKSGRPARTPEKIHVDTSDTSAAREADASFEAVSRKNTRQKRKLTSSDKEEAANQQSPRTRESSDEERRSETGRDEADQHSEDDLESPQPSSRNALVLYSRLQSAGPPDPYTARRVMRVPKSRGSSLTLSPTGARINTGKGSENVRIGRSHNPTTRPKRDSTLEPAKTDVWTAEPERAGDQPAYRAEGNTGKIGDRGPSSLREVEYRDNKELATGLHRSDDELEADKELGDGGFLDSQEAQPQDRHEPEEASGQPRAVFEANSGEPGDRDAPNVYEGDIYDKHLSDSAKFSRLQPASQPDGHHNRASGGRASTSRRKSARVPLSFGEVLESSHPNNLLSSHRRSESPLDSFGARPRTHDEAKGPLDQPHSDYEADSEESGDRDHSRFPESGSRDSNEPRFNEQDETVANRPPRSLADIAAPTRQKDDWDKITSREQEKLDRARWEMTDDEKAHRSVVVDSMPSITRPVMAGSRPGSSSAQNHDRIEPLERHTSWRDKLATTPHRNRVDAPKRRSSLKRSSLVFDANGRPQPIRTTYDHRGAYVGEATSGSHIRVKREGGIDANRVMLDTAPTAAERRPSRPVGSRSQFPDDIGGRLRRTAPEPNVPDWSPAGERKREKDVSRWKRKDMLSLHENPAERRQSMPQHQERRSTAEESSKFQVSLDPEPGISRKPTVTDPEPGDE